MIIIGIVLLVIGVVLAIHILYILGIALLVVGALFAVLGTVGYPVAGRRHYY